MSDGENSAIFIFWIEEAKREEEVARRFWIELQLQADERRRASPLVPGKSNHEFTNQCE